MAGKSVIVSFVLAALIGAVPSPVRDADDADPSILGAMKRKAAGLVTSMPSVGMPKMPSIPAPDFSTMKQSLASEFGEFTDQIEAAMPALNAMGYEVSSFRVQWSLSPKAKLRLKSRNVTDPQKIAAAVADGPHGLVASSIASSAAVAKKIQSTLHMGTVIIDVDFAVPPKIRISFLPSKTDATEDEKALEDMDLACSRRSRTSELDGLIHLAFRS